MEHGRREMERSDVEEVWVVRRARPERMCRPSVQEAWADWQSTSRLYRHGKGLVVGERPPPLLARLVGERIAAVGSCLWAEEPPVHVWLPYSQDC